MKKCPFCAEEIQDAAVKCRWCGEFMKDEKPAEDPLPRPPVGENRKRCLHCSAEIHIEALRCDKCLKWLDNRTDLSHITAPEPPKSENMGEQAATGCIAGWIFGSGGFAVAAVLFLFGAALCATGIGAIFGIPFIIVALFLLIGSMVAPAVGAAGGALSSKEGREMTNNLGAVGRGMTSPLDKEIPGYLPGAVIVLVVVGIILFAGRAAPPPPHNSPSQSTQAVSRQSPLPSVSASSSPATVRPKPIPLTEEQKKANRDLEEWKKPSGSPSKKQVFP